MRTTHQKRQPLGEEGFSLIEILLVVVIIGTLTAMVVPRLIGRSDQARMTAAKIGRAHV